MDRQPQARQDDARTSSLRRFWWLLLLPLLPLCFWGCASAPDPWANEKGSPRVVVTIAPLVSFVRAVAGDRAAVKCLCTTTGPHHYETDYRDTPLINGADVIFGVGLDLDDGFTDALYRRANRPKLPYIKLAKRLPSDLTKKMRQHKHVKPEKGEEAGGHHHHHGEYDPHVWLGIAQVVRMVEVIRDELSKIDPDHAADYKKNADAYIAKLRELEADGRKMLAEKKVKRIISFHDAFEYFADTFGLNIVDVIEIGPGVTPSQKHLAELAKLCQDKDNPIGAITVEPQFPADNARQLQKELAGRGVAIDLVSIDPLETADVAELEKEGADWYETRMRKNLKALAGVLK